MSNTIPSIACNPAPSPDADVVVIGLTEAGGEPTLVGAPEEHLAAALSLGATAKLGTLTFLPGTPRLVVVGLGDADVTPDAVRHAAGAALRAVAGMSGATGWRVAISLELNDPELLEAAVEGALLGAYRIPKVTAEPSSAPVTAVEVVAQPEVAETLDAARVVAEAVLQARDWVNTPPNLLYPASFAESAKELVSGVKVACEILDEKALAKGGYGGLTAVGGGSARPPRLLRLSWAPKGAAFHLALVGKGITFDSGGLDLKPAAQMASMTSDMAGAATVIAATHAIAALNLPIRVTTYAAMAENLPSGSAYRSADVLTMFNGTTVENCNTDAEGRLVLADALGRACTDEPDLIVDVATLTGACVVALGNQTAGLMASDEETADRLLDAAEIAGEALWHLPIPDEARDRLKSEVADLRSTGNVRWGGALIAGAFLQRFVGERSWAHLDIAGPAFNEEKSWGYTPQGGTGVMVRTLVALAKGLAG